ncbi:MAG: MiaB/RimO family radical SAM methylthiotransferase [Bacteroidales bacterium]|nr:MiaB/RimO family radical SAM methylthiotransferase [Bacteroidales bacterium]
MTIAAHTLGCKLNFAETSDTLRRLAAEGHTIVDFREKADIYLINTCTVTAVAEKKCRTAIRQAHRQNPDAQIVVMGCFAQVAADEIRRMPGVTQVLGNESKRLLSYSGEDRTRTFFKIQDGCDYFCTYCAIPYARGRSRSASIEETLCAARRIADSGAKEVVLTGVNTGTFGQSSKQSSNHPFLDLLKGLDQIEGILRYRISSIEPNLLTDDIIDFVAHSRAFLPHFHIPLQAGSDHVLSLMHRRYNTALYRAKLERIKAVMPDACIAADVMAGFNGENEEEFAKVLSFIDSLPISYLHVFTYSDRPGTAALKLGEKIPIPVRHEHTARLLELSEKKHKAFIDSQLGKTRPVLWESTPHSSNQATKQSSNQTMQGWTDNYIRLCRPYDASIVNTVEQVTITLDNIVGDTE